MKFDIEKYNEPVLTYRVKSIIGKFDLQDTKFYEKFTGEININDNWKIGLIVGNSGTGKTTIAKNLFKDAYITNFQYTEPSIIDDMNKDKSLDDIVKTFNSVGFSSPISWLKPYNVLSNGEKMRVDLANALLRDDELIVFDEFTSVVDRNIAKIGSLALQKAINNSNKKFIAVTCHFDIDEWLNPDWVFNTNTMEFFIYEKKNQILDMNYGKLWINKFGTCLKDITI